MSHDSQQAITHVLQQDSPILGRVLHKLRALNQLNQFLTVCLEGELAKHCEVANFENDQLIVITNNAIWAMQFRFQIPAVLAQLRQQPELASLKSIQCKIIPVVGQQQPTLRELRPVQRLTLQTAETVVAIAKTIQHDKLRDIMQKIAKNTG